jgi:hypothetical protein
MKHRLNTCTENIWRCFQSCFFLKKRSTLIVVLYFQHSFKLRVGGLGLYKAVCRLCQPISAQESTHGFSNHPVPGMAWAFPITRFPSPRCVQGPGSWRSIGTGRQPGRGEEGSASSPVRPLVSARCRTEPPQGQGRQRDKPGRSPTQSTETHARR